MKAPDGGCVDGRMYAHSHTDIGRASRYEQGGRQAGLRIPAAIAGARKRGAIGFQGLAGAPAAHVGLGRKLYEEDFSLRKGTGRK